MVERALSEYASFPQFFPRTLRFSPVFSPAAAAAPAAVLAGLYWYVIFSQLLAGVRVGVSYSPAPVATAAGEVECALCFGRALVILVKITGFIQFSANF